MLSIADHEMVVMRFITEGQMKAWVQEIEAARKEKALVLARRLEMESLEFTWMRDTTWPNPYGQGQDTDDENIYDTSPNENWV
jgi:hypothetical protein